MNEEMFRFTRVIARSGLKPTMNKCLGGYNRALKAPDSPGFDETQQNDSTIPKGFHITGDRVRVQDLNGEENLVSRIDGKDNCAEMQLF